MNSLQCIGRPTEVSSKVNEKEAAPLKPVASSTADPVVKEPVEWKPNQQKPKASVKTEGQDPTLMNLKAPGSTRKPELGGKTEAQEASLKTEGNQSTNSKTDNATLKVHISKSSRGYNASKAPSFRNVTTHGHKLPEQVSSIMTVEKQEDHDIQSESVHEPHIQTPREVLTTNDQDPQEAQSEEEEDESAEGHVPLELFAEFLQAVMTKNYQLAKKLCQMILIYEPQNSEAKSFLPLIEEKLLIETDEESDDDDDDDDSDEYDTSEDDDDDDNDEDDDESSDSSDTDEESLNGTDDTLSSSS